MLGDLNREQELSLLSFFDEMTSKKDLESLLDFVIQNAPEILGVKRCSIYLRPEFVAQFDGDLVDDPELNVISAEMIKEEFIVLARTNYPEKQQYIGKIFYEIGVDLTGWVFRTGQTLKLKNAHDTEELRKIDPSLKPSIRYVSVEVDKFPPEKFPILYIPLFSKSRIIGVLKLHWPTSPNGLNETDQKIGMIIGHIIASLIQKDQILKDQKDTILSLANLGAEGKPTEVCKSITAHARKILNCQHVDLYLLDENGKCINLKFRDGNVYDKSSSLTYCPGEGLIGWVYKTGKPLIIDDVREYLEKHEINDTLLSQISDGPTSYQNAYGYMDIINRSKGYISEIKHKSPLLAVPVLAKDNAVQGVLVAHFVSKRTPPRIEPFNRTDLKQMITFASTLSLSFHNDVTRKKSDLLLRLSHSESLSDLYALVARELPSLIRCSDCFVFEVDKDSAQIPLKLKASSRGTFDLGYEFGQDKTGLAALSEKTLVISHFGMQILQNDLNWYFSNNPDDLIENLLDGEKNIVGTIQLRYGRKCNEETQNKFIKFAQELRISNVNGLPSSNLDIYLDKGAKPSFSFAAIPIIKEENGELGGMITFGREYAHVPFSQDEIMFVEAIASSLAPIIDLLKLRNSRRYLLVTLAHEFTTPLTSLRSYIESIDIASANIKDVNIMAKRLLDQLERLEMTSETILAVAGAKELGRKFSKHSLYRPIAESIKPFIEEAYFLGCEIDKPKALNPDGFPTVEMSLGELILAFSNIIQNAVKYSFRPPQEDRHYRFISIKGNWVDSTENYYRIAFQNYGVGITETEISKKLIFQPFYRGILSSDRRRTGSGLGLAYAYKVVNEIHNGSIIANSKHISGDAWLTTISVQLPVRQPINKRKREDNGKDPLDR